MCGFVGISVTGTLKNSARIRGALSKIKHRGPDADGVDEVTTASGHRIELGHCRLAVIDLTDRAAQPMSSADGRYRLVFNGEIYNYRELARDLASAGCYFRSQSDTEVVLNACIVYGKDAPRRFSGMFSFAFIDTYASTIIFGRDRLGKKPLYYSVLAQGIAFASELSALSELGSVPGLGDVDPVAIRQVLEFGFMPGERTIFRCAKKLAPATVATFSLDRNEFVDSTLYWDPGWKIGAAVTPNHAGFGDLFETAVSSRLVGDVPLAVFLSGGVDSSLVYAETLRQRPGTVAYTVSFPGYATDESAYAKEVASRLVGELRCIPMTQDDFSSAAQMLLDVVDEPIADPAMIPLFHLSRSVVQDYKVVLGGDGGDEVFGGYVKYSAQELIEKIPLPARRLLKRLLRLSNDQRIQRIGSCIDRPFAERQFVFGSGGIFGSRLPKIETCDELEVYREVIERDKIFYNDPFRRSMYLDLLFQLPDWYLYKADRATMAAGLEMRSPFLDQDLITYSFGLPVSKHRGLSQRKVLLKTKLAKILPDKLVYRKKLGFAVNLRSWLGQKDVVESVYEGSLAGFVGRGWIERNFPHFDDNQKYKVISLARFLSRFT